MRILMAVDQNPYSESVVRVVAALAKNTWAHVTILGIASSPQNVEEFLAGGRQYPLASTLDECRKRFLRCFSEADSPYGHTGSDYSLVQSEKNIFSLEYPEQNEHKELKVRIRAGNAAKEILAESVHSGADLIVIGCDSRNRCQWAESDDVPRKIVKNADCSVFVVKEEKQPRMIDCCLDHDTVSQASIELINQLVTLYQVELEIIGLADEKGLGADVDRRMTRILDYYTSRGIKAWVRIVDAPSLDTAISHASENNLVALWMGKASFLDKIFSRQRLEHLVETAASSVLILR